MSFETLKPMVKKSKSALKKLKKWNAFKLPKKTEIFQHIFLNLSLRVHSFNSMLCDSDQELLNMNVENFEFDMVYKPRNKLVLRSFTKNIQVEDVTQFTLYPKVKRKSFLTP